MEKIQNIYGYIKSMSATMSDKCWWLEKIPSDIDTVVDFGCAQGDLEIYLDRLNPGRFHYIGIDNSPEMLDLARYNHGSHFGREDSQLYSSLEEADGTFDPSKSILVLNSVIHEIYSYMEFKPRDFLLHNLFNYGFKYIAIRDMYPFYIPVDAAVKYIIDIKEAQNKRYADIWDDYRDRNRGEAMSFLVEEFLLKYRYIDNWEREVGETYLWNWSHDHMIFSGFKYRVISEINFAIPFIRNRIREDMGFDFPYNTHKKMLLELKQGQ